VRRELKRKEEPVELGTFGARRVTNCTRLPNTHSAVHKKRVAQFMVSTECPIVTASALVRSALRAAVELSVGIEQPAV